MLSDEQQWIKKIITHSLKSLLKRNEGIKMLLSSEGANILDKYVCTFRTNANHIYTSNYILCKHFKLRVRRVGTEVRLRVLVRMYK